MLTDEQVADKLEISRRTIYNWRKKSKVIDQAINLGKSHTDTLVENSLLQQALQGNVTAQIFWLKNRKPTVWRDRQETNVNLKNDEPIEDKVKKIKEYLHGGDE